MKRASPADRDYFERLGRQNRALPADPIPTDLADMFDRLEAIRRAHGRLVEAGRRESANDGDLGSHLALLDRMRSQAPHGTNSA